MQALSGAPHITSRRITRYVKYRRLKAKCEDRMVYEDKPCIYYALACFRASISVLCLVLISNVNARACFSRDEEDRPRPCARLGRWQYTLWSERRGACEVRTLAARCVPRELTNLRRALRMHELSALANTAAAGTRRHPKRSNVHATADSSKCALSQVISVFSLRSGLLSPWLSLLEHAKLLPTELIPRTIALYVPHMRVNTYLTSSSALLAHL